MKQLIILILVMLITNSCQSQDQKDLEQININNIEGGELFLKVNKFDQAKDVIRWGYPNYLTYDMEKFRWGDIKFSNNKDIQKNKLELIMDPTESYPIVINIVLFQEEVAKRILKHLQNQYGEAVVLEKEHKPEELFYTAYFWKDIKPGQSLIWCISYSELNDQLVASMDLLVIKNETNIVGQDYDYNDMNALEYLIFQYSRWPMEKIKEILQK